MKENQPQGDDEAIENVESILNVLQWSICHDLQDHFDGEQTGEQQVAKLQDGVQDLRLGGDE